MSQYNFFHGNWVDCSPLFEDKSVYTEYDDLKVSLSSKFFDDLKFDEESLKHYRMQATFLANRELGGKPAIAFSGGIDSQCAVLCFKELGIPCDIYVLKFKYDLNIHDIKNAYKFATENNIELKEIELDVMNFLSRENHDYGMKYKSPSPQFNVHFKMFNILQSMGYSGVVCGGNSPLQTKNGVWGSNFQRNSQSYMNYTKESGFMCQGNFLSFYPNLAWAIALMTPATDILDHSVQDYLTRIYAEDRRYADKLIGYKKVFSNIMPQDKKYTGFETIKQLLWDKTKDGYTFEKLYRYPLEKTVLKYPMGKPRFVFNDKVEDKIKSIYLNNLKSL